MLGRIKNKVSPEEQLPTEPTEPTEGDKKLEELANEVGEEGKFDKTLNVDSSVLTREIEEQKKQQKQQEQLKESVEKEKVEVEGLTSISGKMDGIIKTSLKRIKGHVKRYGIDVDPQFFSKQVIDLETKLTSLNKEIETIKEEINEKGKKIDEKTQQKDIINDLINYNRFVRLNNKMKEEYDTKKYEMNEAFSMRLQPLFDKGLKDIGEIEALNELTIQEDDPEKKTKETLEKSIDEIRKDITLKYNKLISLIETFVVYNENENKLNSNLNAFINAKKQEEEYKKKKNYIGTVKDELEKTLDFNDWDDFNDALSSMATFMGRLTKFESLYEIANREIKDYTDSFNEAKRELDGLEFVEAFEKEFEKNREYTYTGDVEFEFNDNTVDLKDYINDFLKDSVTRLIYTSFINGIQKSNITDYRKEDNGKDYFIAYIYTLVYNLGDFTRSPLTKFEGISEDDTKKQNNIGAYTIDGIKKKDYDFQEDSFPLTDIGEFYGLELLERKHITFLKRYRGDITNDLLYEILFAIIVKMSGIDYDTTIKPFYEEIIKTDAEREEAKKKFTEDEFNYYLTEEPYLNEDLLTEMDNFVVQYTRPGQTGLFATRDLDILLTKIKSDALSQFLNNYSEKKRTIGNESPKKPEGDNYITPEHYESFINFFETPIPLPSGMDISEFGFDMGGEEGQPSPLTHAFFLNEIVDNLPNILKSTSYDKLSEFKTWFFKDNDVRAQLEGTKAFKDTQWYQNHIAKLEEFLDKIISKRIDNKPTTQGSPQGSPQSGGSQKRRKDTRRKLRKDTRRKLRKDTRRKRKDTRRKLRKDTRRKRKDTRRKRKDTRRKTRK
jgi:hypothetical protein